MCFFLKDDDFYKTPKWKINPSRCQRIKMEIRKCVKLNAMENMTYETMAVPQKTPGPKCRCRKGDSPSQG